MDIQKNIVLEIVRASPNGIRTPDVKIEAMYKGCSCSDRYLRWLSEEGKIKGERLAGDATKTWTVLKEENGQLIRGCLGKKVYRTQQYADALVRRIFNKSGVQLRVYACKYCLGWHLTSKRKND